VIASNSLTPAEWGRGGGVDASNSTAPVRRAPEFTQFHPTCLYNPTPKTPDERRVLPAGAAPDPAAARRGREWGREVRSREGRYR